MSDKNKNVDDNGIPSKKKRENEQDGSNKYVKGSAKVTLADINNITFKIYLVINGYDNFTYAIFDEWHMLNSEE